MARQMVMGYSLTPTEVCTLENGLTINNTDLEPKVGITIEFNTQVTSSMEKNQVMESLSSMEGTTKASFWMGSFMEWESISLQTQTKRMKVNLEITIWKAGE